MRSNRQLKSIWVLPAVAMLSITSFAGVAGAQTITDQGTSEDLVAPPSPNCPVGAITLVSEVEFTSAGSPIDAPILGVGDGLETSLDIDGFVGVEAGTIDIIEIITYDAHTGRALWPAQDNESVALEFSLDGDVVARSEFTPDLDDGVNSAWVVSSLGEVGLAEGADAVRIVHFNQENNNDSVVVASACATFTPGDVETLTLGERIEMGTGVDAEADSEGSDGEQLAVTGANEIAFAIIALGVMIFGIAFKIQGQDPRALRPEQF